jgi:signal transduction histidine kinase
MATQNPDEPDRSAADARIIGIQREMNQQLLIAGIRVQEQLDDARESQRASAEDANAHQLREAELLATAEFRERMLGIIGHDLRNPLNTIIMACGLLMSRGGLTEADSLLVNRIVNSGQRMTRMISQLVGFTQATLGGDFGLTLELSDLGDICRNIADELRLSSSVDVRVTIDGDSRGFWDADRLAEVVSNIAGNAVDHAALDTSVLVSCRGDGADVCVEITNQGICIPPDMLPLIFNAFLRGQVVRAAQPGHLGLGLYIASQIVKSHGGSLGVRSSDGTTVFSLRLPRRLPNG